MKTYKDFFKSAEESVNENSINVDRTRKALNKRMGELRTGIKAFKKSLSSDEEALLTALPTGVKGYSDISSAIIDIENALAKINNDLLNGQTWDKSKLSES